MEKTIQTLPRLTASRKDLKKVPEEPGIYIFFNKKVPLYVGKAVNLKNRLSSYFTLNLSPKTKRMLSEAKEFSFIRVQTELNSLLLEAKIVHDLKPRYNAALKDDKHPLYIRLTKEKYPRVTTARKIEEDEPNIAFYGPFPSSSSVRLVLRMIRKIFPYSEHKLGKRPCLYSHLGLCNPCPNEIENLQEEELKQKARERYLKNIKNIKKILERQTDGLLKDLYKKMASFAKIEDFENAGVLRDQIRRLEYITQPILPFSGFLENPNLVDDLRQEELKDLKNIIEKNSQFKLENLERIECFDIAHLTGASPTASMVTFVSGEPDKNFYRHFRIRQKEGMDDISSMKEVIKRRIKNLEKWGKPDLMIVDGGKGQVSAFTEALKNLNIPIVGLAKQFETLVIPKIGGFSEVRLLKSPSLHLVQRIRDEAHRFARRYHHKLLKKYLNLEK